MKIARRLLALILIASLCAGTISMTAFAADTVEVESLPGGGSETIDVTITVSEDGKTTVAENEITDSGNVVNYNSQTFDNVVTGVTGQTEWDASNPYTGYSASGGSETTKEQVAPNVTVDVPLTENESNTEYGPTAGTSSTTGSAKENNSASYDQTTTTVEKQGSVTVTNTGISVTEKTTGESTDMDYISSDAVPDKDNDLFYNRLTYFKAPSNLEEMQEFLKENPVTEGYEYIILDSYTDSQFYAAFLYTEPKYEGEQPVYTDENGNEYYTGHKKTGNGYNIEGIYVDGALASGDTVKGVWSNIAHYTILDAKTGEVITTYCADQTNPTNYGYSYTMQNVEDAGYYTDEQAAMIRTIASNGYWGVSDDESTKEAEYGSLAAVKNMMRKATDENGAPIFTDDEIESLTDGMAMTATQYAIWTYSAKMEDIVFINAHWMEKGEDGYSVVDSADEWYHSMLKDIPEGRESDVAVIMKLYNYLINLDPTSFADDEKNTSNTIINEQNFLKDLSITVLEKEQNHENNEDDIDTNDAYSTNLTFALLVTPSTESGDDLVVKVFDVDGNEIACGRIAGEAQEGETVLIPDENGNYSFSGITMIEGEQNINITLEGIQNLEEGVYLYTSELKDNDTSQTMVGVASGIHEVNVSMNISFEVAVDDEVIVTERVWRNESNYAENDPPENDPPENDPPENDPPENDPPENDPLEEIPDEPIPLADIPEDDTTVEIPDGDIPLADVPQTGDMSIIWFGISALSGLGLAGIKLFGKKKDDEE